MSIWQVEKIWENKECFIIGGGASLKGFKWDLLAPELTIGCNNAYQLGADICKVCIFGDVRWFERNNKELESYKGMVFTNVSSLLNSKIPYLNTMKRKANGFYTDSLGWNSNTGFSAINLALLFGAKVIYLLGFDMKLSKDGKHNWHDKRLDKSGAEVYRRFLKSGGCVTKDWKGKFPDQQVINVVKPSSSDLAIFPTMNFDEFWNSRKKVG